MTASLAVSSMPNLGETPRADLLNLLIVDDERSVREGCREVAQSLGFNTFVAENAEHAYRVLEAQNIDVVLLDLRLPGGASGLEVLRRSSAASRRPWSSS